MNATSTIRSPIRAALLVAAAAFASSCAVGPSFHKPDAPANAGYAPTPLPEAITELLRSGLGVDRPTPVPDSIDQVTLTPIRLGTAPATACTEIVGAEPEPFCDTRAESLDQRVGLFG